MELKIQTDIGELTGIFELYPIDLDRSVYLAYFKEKSSVIVEAESIPEAINELLISLNILTEHEKRHSYRNYSKLTFGEE